MVGGVGGYSPYSCTAHLVGGRIPPSTTRNPCLGTFAPSFYACLPYLDHTKLGLGTDVCYALLSTQPFVVFFLQ